MTQSPIVTAQGEIITALMNVSGFSNRVYSVYPKQATDYPCCVVDTPARVQYRRIAQNVNTMMMRISCIDTDPLNVDTLTDAVESYLEGATLTNTSYHGVQSQSPLIWDETISAHRRDLDVKIRIIQNR